MWALGRALAVADQIGLPMALRGLSADEYAECVAEFAAAEGGDTLAGDAGTDAMFEFAAARGVERGSTGFTVQLAFQFVQSRALANFDAASL